VVDIDLGTASGLLAFTEIILEQWGKYSEPAAKESVCVNSYKDLYVALLRLSAASSGRGVAEVFFEGRRALHRWNSRGEI